MSKLTFRFLKSGLGFTVLEVMIALALSAVVVVATIPAVERKMVDGQIAKANAEIQQILIQAREHRVATGSWPASVSVLIANNRLPGNAGNSPFGTAYTLNVLAGNNLQLSVDTTDTGKSIRLAGTDLPFVSRAGNIVSTQVTPAGSEASLSQFYRLDGSTPLTGNMDGGGNSISNINQLNANGNITTSAIVQGSRVQASDIMLSRNGFASMDNPSYILRPDGQSNIRNLNAEEVRGTYLRSSGEIYAQGNISADGNISTSADISGRNGIFTGNLNSTGTITGNSIVSNGNIEGTNISATNQISAPTLFATNKFVSERFESPDPTYGISPRGTSQILDLYARDIGANYLQVAGNIYTQGRLISDNGLHVSGGSAAYFDGPVFGRNTTFYGNAFASFNNSGFVVIPDGVSQLNRINANYIQGGTVTATGSVNGQQFVDTNDTSKLIDPDGDSNINNIQVNGRGLFNDLSIIRNYEVGQPCTANSIGMNSAGDMMVCKGGAWAIVGGGDFSKVITGEYKHGDKIPLPVGYRRSECEISVSTKVNVDLGSTTRHSGGAADVSSERIGRCESRVNQEWHNISNNDPSINRCSYVVTCNKADIKVTTGLASGETVQRDFSHPAPSGGKIFPLSGFTKNQCDLVPVYGQGADVNITHGDDSWSYVCTLQSGWRPGPYCALRMTCTVP